MVDFLTSGPFLVTSEILVITALITVLIWRFKKNREITEKRQKQLEKERDDALTMRLKNNLAGYGTSPSGKGSGSVRIRIREGEKSRTETYPSGRNVRIGRSRENDLVLKSPYIARRQCALVWQNGRLFLEQTDAMNQIMIRRSGGKKEYPAEMERVNAGDTLVIADCSLEILTEDSRG